MAHGTFGQILSVALKIGIPHTENSGYFEKKYALPSLIRNVAPGKKCKN
jgi:hypothetical protein